MQPLTIEADPRHFRALLGIMGVAVLSVAGLVGYVFVNQPRLDLGVAAAGLALLGGLMLSGRQFVKSTSVPRVILLVSLSILIFVVALSLAGNRTSTLALSCLVAVLIAVPYVERQTLRRLGLVAWLAAAFVGLLFALSLGAGAPFHEGAIRFLGVCLNMSLALFAIFHLSARLNAGAQRYRDLFQRVPVGMYRTTPEGRFLDVNGAFADMFGLAGPAELADVPADDLYADPADRLQFRSAVDSVGVARQVEYRARRPDGRIFWIRDSALLVSDAIGRPLYYEGIVEDVTERKLHELKLEQRASRDSLTGLANRAVLMDLLDEALHDASPERTVALLFVDLDDFKQVNDRFGHAAGDALLVEVGHRLSLATRSADTVARFGGDEFAVLLEVPSGPSVAEAVTARIGASFAEPFTWAAHELRLGVSVGIAIADEPLPTAELIRRADAQMYEAKAGDQGRRSTRRH